MAAAGVENRLEQATRLMNAGDLDAAQTVLGELLGSEPGSVPALRLSGVIACLRGRHDLAVGFLDQLLSMEPDDLQALVIRAGAHNAMSRYAEAEAGLKHALALNPGSYDVNVNLAMTYWASSDLEQAEIYFKQALALDAGSFLANFYLGRIADADEDFAAAETYFRRAAELGHNNAESRSCLGKVLQARGATDEALEAFEGAASIEPAEISHRLLAARAAFELAQEARAWKHLEVMAAQSGTAFSRARLEILEWWCKARHEDVLRIAKHQNHKFAPVRVLPAASVPPDLPAALTPEVFVARLAGCRVMPRDHLLVSADDAVFITGVMSRPLHRPHLSPHIIQACDDGRMLLAHPSAIRPVKAPCAYLGAAESYCDWVLECLTRLWAYRQLPQSEGLPLVVQAGMTAWQKDLLALLEVGEERQVVLDEDAVTVFDELHVASPSAPLNVVAPYALEHLRRTLRKSLPPQADSPKRLFLSRQGSTARRIANFSELEPKLARHGFAVIDAGATPAAVLLGMVGSADVVIGAEGAAMANVFFAPAHAKVALVTANAGNALRYCAGSRALGQAFTFLQGDAVFESSEQLAECDIRLDPLVFDAYLSGL